MKCEFIDTVCLSTEAVHNYPYIDIVACVQVEVFLASLSMATQSSEAKEDQVKWVHFCRRDVPTVSKVLNQ